MKGLPPAWRPLADGHGLRIEIEPQTAARGAADLPGLDDAWARICAGNPRAFNGPILSFVSGDPATNTVRARRDEYRMLAVQPGIETGVVQLGVTGVLEARDRAGEPHVLLGKRSSATRVFGGMWEFGPSGGVDPPPIGRATMDADDLWRVLINEIREEVGLPVDPDPRPPVGLLADPTGQSVELIVRVPIVRPVEDLVAMIEAESGTGRWEYDAVRWVARRDLSAFAEREPLIGTASDLIRILGSD